MPSDIKKTRRRDTSSQSIRNLAIENVSISAEAVSIPAGAAAAVVSASFRYAPVLDSRGLDIGFDGDTSISLTSTAFTNEVEPREDAALSNGDYWVDYQTGYIRGKKADSSTSATASYRSRRLSTGTSGSGGGLQVEGNVANGATDSGNPVLMGAVYTTVDPVYSNNQRARLRTDSAGYLLVRDGYVDRSEDDTNEVRKIARPKLATTTYCSPIKAISTALEASRVIKALPGVINYGYFEVDQSAPTGRYYIQFLNYTALPPDGPVTSFWPSITVDHTTGTTSKVILDTGDDPIEFSVGGVICLSTTQFNKTISGAYLKMGIKAS